MEKDFDEDWIAVGNVPTHVCTWGRSVADKSDVHDDDKYSNFNEKSLLLLISGNPGVVKYYQPFLASLYKKLMMPVWVISHAGHELPPKDKKNVPPLLNCDELYNVDSQIIHKAEFIQKFLPPDKDIYIIAHSFGAKVTVELLKDESIRKRIKNCYLVFPTLERIGDTPNGKFIQFVIKYLFSITIFFAFIFSLFPYSLKWWLIKIYFFLNGRFNFPPNCIAGTIDLVNYTVLRNVFNLANNEMDKICELDKQVIEECIDKLKVYFGANDGWAPVEHHKNLIKHFPKIDSNVLDSKYEHCFMFNLAEEFALELSEHIKADIK